jgi:isoleucyl-tRNA synthetase
VTVERNGERLIVAEALRERALGDDGRIVETFPGSRLVGATYEPLYENVDANTHRVVEADFVSLEEGTGIVHIAPGFGAEDLELGRREGWAVFKPVDDAGRFTDEAPAFVRGKFVKDADPAIIEDLRERGLLISAADYEHTYPLCWRCETPLLYIARTSWYVRTTARKDRLLDVNESVNWYPEHIKHGRYGDWLENNVDWALSRDRYWGTPLPVWRCAQRHVTVVGSLKELSDLAGRNLAGIDPHRPAVDEVEIPCSTCGEPARRVPQVIDAWYDSGAMPYAQWGYHPELGRGEDGFKKSFPADFICEGIDQTRGWFYSLMAEATLLFDDTAYRNCVVLGLLVDRDGRKMSKRLGNVMDPSAAIDRFGADAVRWFFIAKGSPWDTRRVSFEAFEEVIRQFLLTLWNVYVFFVTYANVDDFDPDGPDVPLPERPVLDRWILSQLAETVEEAREAFERYDATSAGRRVGRFVDDLSNWYVRRARRRFWDPGRGGAARDKSAAYLTLSDCLLTVAQLIAPITPFIAEELWRNLAAGRAGRAESVHLSDYPTPRPEQRDSDLDAAMQIARDIVSLGREARTNAGVRVRQPLARAAVHLPGHRARPDALLPLVADELNVKEVVFAESAEELGRWRAKPNFRALGPKLGQTVKDLAAFLARDDGTIAARLARGESVTVDLGGAQQVELGPEDVDLSQETMEGWGVASEGGLTVALDLDVTPELKNEGLAREVVRLVQDARKAAALNVADRIVLGIETSNDLADAVREHGDYITRETLAIALEQTSIDDALREETAEIDGERLEIRLRRA